jgi:hypothetical protein
LQKEAKHIMKDWIAKPSGAIILQIFIIGSSAFFAYSAIRGIRADDVVFGRTGHTFHFHGLAGWLIAAGHFFWLPDLHGLELLLDES